MASSSNLGAERRARLAAARLYLVCDSTPGGRELPAVLGAAVAGGVDVVQLRDKRLGKEQLAVAALQAGALCRRLGALFVVNDDPEVALAAEADGVHVGQQDMPVAQVRELVGANVLVGLSTHAAIEIDAAERYVPALDVGIGAPAARDNSAGVDYIGVGPVHMTPTKPGRPATGLELVRYAAVHAHVPFFAIGGIHAGNSAAAIAVGARRVAVLRAIADAADPERAARELRVQLDGVNESSCFHTPAA
jgi:thiamine-phosphate pyrophosphorylase